MFKKNPNDYRKLIPIDDHLLWRLSKEKYPWLSQFSIEDYTKIVESTIKDFIDHEEAKKRNQREVAREAILKEFPMDSILTMANSGERFMVVSANDTEVGIENEKEFQHMAAEKLRIGIRVGNIRLDKPKTPTKR